MRQSARSHFGSVIDIILGSFRFAVNAYTRQDTKKLEAAPTLLKLIAPLFGGLVGTKYQTLVFSLAPNI